jgi:hypothetical protein
MMDCFMWRKEGWVSEETWVSLKMNIGFILESVALFGAKCYFFKCISKEKNNHIHNRKVEWLLNSFFLKIYEIISDCQLIFQYGYYTFQLKLKKNQWHRPRSSTAFLIFSWFKKKVLILLLLTGKSWFFLDFS